MHPLGQRPAPVPIGGAKDFQPLGNAESGKSDFEVAHSDRSVEAVKPHRERTQPRTRPHGALAFHCA